MSALALQSRIGDGVAGFKDLSTTDMEKKRKRARHMGLALLVVISNFFLFLSACSITELPVVRQAPTLSNSLTRVTATPRDSPIIAISTFIPTPTPTITPVPMTESGLYVYDNFESGTQIDWDRWNASREYFTIQDGVLSFTAPRGTVLSSDANFRTDARSWKIEIGVPVRFSIESKIMVDRTVAFSGRLVAVSLQLTGPLDYWFALGYVHDIGRFQYECVGSRGTQDAIYFLDTGSPGFNEWHTFRISIEEILGSDDLAIVAYVDDIRVCYYWPPGGWQTAIDQRQEVSLLIVNWWQGSWDLEEPLRTYFDDIAISVDESQW